MHQTEQTSRARPTIFFISDVSIGNVLLVQEPAKAAEKLYAHSPHTKINSAVQCTAQHPKVD